MDDQLLKDIVLELKGIRLDLNTVITALASINTEMESVASFLDKRVIWNNEKVTVESPDGKTLFEGRISTTRRFSPS
ncbi:MAG: hypothetical protein HY961_11395 [Ignavibacteriae bacterium]|nr:hypothetical protein [Ignavibacteriota bacterium]